MTSITAYEILSATKGRRFGENPFKEDDEQIQSRREYQGGAHGFNNV